MNSEKWMRWSSRGSLTLPHLHDTKDSALVGCHLRLKSFMLEHLTLKTKGETGRKEDQHKEGARERQEDMDKHYKINS